jgi:hypothetical protein
MIRYTHIPQIAILNVILFFFMRFLQFLHLLFLPQNFHSVPLQCLVSILILYVELFPCLVSYNKAAVRLSVF